MSVQLVNSHVLLPHLANYKAKPRRKRRWQTGISEGVTGAESRQAFRAKPLISLAWTVTPWSLQEQTQLDDRIRAAKKSGKGCAPYWGRASILQNACNGSSAVLLSTHWNWSEDDYIFFLDATDPKHPVFNVRQVTAVVGQTLTLSSAVSQTFAAGSFVWPLLFGKFEMDGMPVANPERVGPRLKISEMLSADDQDLGSAPAPDGIGEMAIGTTLEVQ